MKHEMLNCLEEASIHCASLNVPQAKAPFVVNVRQAYYCRSTDAFAGTYLCESKGFATRAEAEAYSDKVGEDYELFIEVLPPRPAAILAPLNESEIPF